MFNTDLLIAFGLMGLLFLRQIAILKDPNKINYAPLMLSIGTLSSIVHFMIHPERHDLVLLTRESLFPLLVAVILYIIMNVLHQTQQSYQARMQEEFSSVVVQEITQLKSFIEELETRMNSAQNETLQTQQEIRKKFIDDVRALSSIKENQEHFLEKFLQVEAWHEDVKNSFSYFSKEQLPKLDDVVHKHIDILRISESDHYNKLHELLRESVETKLDNLTTTLADTISDEIVRNSTQQLLNVTKDFEKEMLLLKSNTGVVATSLHEGESILSNIRTQSELIMKQMILSSKKMDKFADTNNGMSDVFEEFKILIDEIERIKSDYVKSQAQLNILTKELQINSKEELNAMGSKFDTLSKELCEKIDTSLENLHQHYHIVGEDVTKKANLLAKKAQIQKGYSDIAKE